MLARCAGLAAQLALLVGTAAVCAPQSASTSSLPPPIEASIVVEAPLADVWAAWTTSTGVPTFMGFEAEVDARPRGLFRVTFERAKQAPLDRGNDGIVLAVEPLRMLSVSWMTPMHIASLRGNSTLLSIYFDGVDEGRRTLVRIVNTGYGTGGDWADAYAYNVRGWRNVLAALEYRFRTGPIDWDKALQDRARDGKWPWKRANEGGGDRAAQSEFRDCPDCPLMRVVPPGRFSMGSPGGADGELEDGADEGPVRQVTIGRALAVSKYEVTVAEFGEFVAATGHALPGGCRIWMQGVLENRAAANWRDPGFEQTGRHPATCVSWRDAQAYVAWLRERTRLDYRLPTEAEWEYAARGGSAGRYSFGDDLLSICHNGNVADLDAARALAEDPPVGCRRDVRVAAACRTAQVGALSSRLDIRAPSVSVAWEVVRCRDGVGDRTAPVGSFAPNAFGLYDTVGNVWEWVEDCYAPDYRGAPVDGAAVTLSSCRQRVLRGGAWAMNTDGWRAADRDRDDPETRYAVVGFRVVRALH